MTERSPKFVLHFLGATETVTGSRYLLESERSRVLVDCGLFQGYKKLRQRNWAPPGFEPAGIQAVILTHAHLDHTGYLPRLVNAGYTGPVYCTPGTRDLLHILLPDAGHLQEEEARLASQYGFSRHAPPLPLFTREDALRCLEQLRVVDYRTSFAATDEVRGRFTRAGHIVGSACLTLELGQTSIAFSGDVGRPNDPIMSPPEPLPTAADYLVIESTYGDRRHSDQAPAAELGRIVAETVARGGTLVIPAFAVGRAQHILHLLAGLRKTNQLPEVPIFLDSPMAIDATEIFRQHVEEHRLSGEECREMCGIAHYSRSADESKAIDASPGPMIIISASGMATGGRVLHHLTRFLPDERNAVLLVGYQSAGDAWPLVARRSRGAQDPTANTCRYALRCTRWMRSQRTPTTLSSSLGFGGARSRRRAPSSRTVSPPRQMPCGAGCATSSPGRPWCRTTPRVGHYRAGSEAQTGAERLLATLLFPSHQHLFQKFSDFRGGTALHLRLWQRERRQRGLVSNPDI